MNKALFNEGGQPFFLDDIELIQNNSFGMLSYVLEALAGANGVYLLNPLEVATAPDYNNGTLETEIKANCIIYQGNIIPFQSATLNVTSQGPKIGVRITDSDLRECSDGANKPCRKMYEAFLFVGQANADVSYDLYDLECLYEVMGRKSGQLPPNSRWKHLPVAFANGYSGSIRYTLGSIPQMRIDIKSPNTSWGETPGCIARYPDHNLLMGIWGHYEAVSYIPLAPDDTYFPYQCVAGPFIFSSVGSGIDIINDGTIRIYNHIPTGNETTYNEAGNAVHKPIYTDQYGVLPPCQEGDEYGAIKITIKQSAA